MIVMMIIAHSSNAWGVWHNSCLVRLACSRHHGRQHKQEHKNQNHDAAQRGREGGSQNPAQGGGFVPA